MYRVMNKPNKEIKNKDILNEEMQMLYDNICGIRQGEYVFCMNDKQKDDLLSYFDNSDEFIIKKVDGVWCILPENTTKFFRKEFEEI